MELDKLLKTINGIEITDLPLRGELEEKAQETMESIYNFVTYLEKETGLKVINIAFEWTDDGVRLSPVFKGNITHT